MNKDKERKTDRERIDRVEREGVRAKEAERKRQREREREREEIENDLESER